MATEDNNQTPPPSEPSAPPTPPVKTPLQLEPLDGPKEVKTTISLTPPESNGIVPPSVTLHQQESNVMMPPSVDLSKPVINPEAPKAPEIPDIIPEKLASAPLPETAAPVMPEVPVTAATTALPKKKTLSITIKDKVVLYAAYMPFLKNGGLFIPTKKTFAMGEECSLVITLLEEENKYNVTGRVVWITPPGSPTNKAGGIGIEFSATDEGEKVRRKIEDLLATLLQSGNATHTM